MFLYFKHNNNFKEGNFNNQFQCQIIIFEKNKINWLNNLNEYLTKNFRYKLFLFIYFKCLFTLNL